MKNILKRVLSFALALTLVLSMVPVSLNASAAGTIALTEADLGVAWTDSSSASGGASWTGNGSAITGTATGYTTGMGIIKNSVTTTLTLTNNKSQAAKLAFDYTLTGGGSVAADAGTMADGKFSCDLAKGASVTITLTSPSGVATNTLSITNIVLVVEKNVTSTFTAATNGSYTVGGEKITKKTTKTQLSTKAYDLVATPNDGYQFFGWWSAASQSYVSYEASVSLMFASDPKLTAHFVKANAALFTVGTAKFDDLTKAVNYAAENGIGTVVLANDGTVSGKHTIPAGVTLLVPFNAESTCYTAAPGNIGATGTWEKPYAYRTLNLAAGATLTVNGAISVSAKHGVGPQKNAGSPSGACGFITMGENSSIVLNDGANLYAWGYIHGEGTVTANSGATVYENFQFTDFRGGDVSSTMGTSGKAVFPMSQYYVQNIEVPVTFHYGATEKVYTSVYAQMMVSSATVTFIGEGAMFSLEKGATLTKEYSAMSDELYITVRGDGAINGISLTLVGNNINSSDYVLPLNSNISVRIASGTTTLNQDLALLPGTSLTIDKNAQLTVAEGHDLIVYDGDEWGNYVYSDAKMVPVPYTPINGTNVIRKESSLVDAKLDINGTLVANGGVYTTESGANVISSGACGQIILKGGAGSKTVTYQAKQSGHLVTYDSIAITPVQLKNADGTYVATAGSAKGDVYYNYNSGWTEVTTGGTVTFNVNGGTGKVNAVTGKSALLPAEGITKAGYTLAGWNTAADGSGTSYAAGVEIAVTGDMTLYAVWAPIPTVITSQPVSVKKGANTGKSVFTVEAEGYDLSYQWQYKLPNGKLWLKCTIAGANTNTLKVPSVCGRSGYRYRCIVTSSNGTKAISNVAYQYILGIKVQPKGQKVIKGTTATFTVEATGLNKTYQWQYKSNGKWLNCTLNGSKTATLKVPATCTRSGIQYRCVIKDAAGNTKTTNAVFLYVLGVKTQPTRQVVKNKETATFTVKATGLNKTFQWQYRVGPNAKWQNCIAPGNKTATMNVEGTKAKSGYQYRCVIKDSAGNTVYTNVVGLYVLGIKTQPTRQVVKNGATATFTVNATGHNKTYQWQYRTSAKGKWINCTANGNKTATLKVPATKAKSGYQYRCVIKDSAGNTVYTNAVGLFVLGVKAQPTSVSAKAGKTVTFSVSATGLNKTYQWQYRTSANGKWQTCTLKGAKTATLTVGATKVRNGYQYRCVITDAAGNKVYSNAATLTVK